MIWRAASGLARLLPGEEAHRLAIRALSAGVAPRVSASRHGKLLKAHVAGLDFPNPIGLAAGFDKDAEAMEGALGLGFGFVEVGTLTPLPQPGNPKPRVFRLPEDGAVINRYGFNNRGMENAAIRLAAFRQRYQGGGILGVNIGANKESQDRVGDYGQGAAYLAPFADYMTVNVSSPNTPGLRGLQEPGFLAEVLDAAMAGMKSAGAVRPLLLKLAPDLDEDGLSAAIAVAGEKGCAGLIIANTTISRPDHLRHRHRHETGGLSGVPLFELSTRVLSRCRQLAPVDLPIVAAGGVHNAATAYAKILAGADLVQLYTALAIEGVTLPGQILDGLAALLHRDGLASLAEARGAAATWQEACQVAGV